METRKRRRPALACARCRRRKIRCDQQEPCGHCVKSNNSECLYPDSHGPVGRFARAKTPSQGYALPPLAPRSGHSPGPATARSSTQSASTPGIESLVTRVGSLEKSTSAPSRSGDDAGAKYEYTQGGGPATTTRDQPKSEPPKRHWFANQSSWMNHTSLCSRVLECLSQAQAEDPEFRSSIKQCSALGQRLSAQTTGSVNVTLTDIAARMPTRAITDQLLDAYFDTFADVFRLFHTPSFRAEYQEYWREPTAARQVFVLQMQVCMALGIMTSNDALQFGNLPTQWLAVASAWLVRSPGWSRKRLPPLEELQLSCLLCLAESSGPKTERASWVEVGDLVRKAMALSLHRDPIHVGIHEPHDVETRRRLWACIMELNLLMSLQAGQPPLVSSLDWDTRASAALLDEKLDAAGPTGRTHDVRHATPSTQPLLYESLHLRSLIASRVSEAGETLPYSELLGLYKQLSQAHGRLKKDLAAQDEANGGSRSSTSLADVVFLRYFLALHLPVLGKSIKDPEFHFSRRACADVAIKILGFCGIGGDVVDNEPDLTVQRVFVNSSGLFRALAMQPMYAVLLELVSACEERLESTGAPPAWDEAQIRRLAALGQAWMESRLRSGSGEVHGCCFVAACRVYADGLASGSDSDVDRLMAEAAFEASKRCQDCLSEALRRLESVGTTTSSGAPFHNTEAVNDAAALDDDWLYTFTMTGAEDFLDFDWDFPMAPVMLPTEGNDVSMALT